MKFSGFKKIAFLLIFVFIFSPCFANNNFASNSNSSESEAAEAEKPTDWKKNLRSKLDTTIAVMDIIKEDIAELDAQEKEEAKKAPKVPPEEQTWQEKFIAKMNRAIKIIRIIRNDLSDFDKVEAEIRKEEK